MNGVYNAPFRQCKVNNYRGFTRLEHCTFAFAALYNGPLFLFFVISDFRVFAMEFCEPIVPAR